MLLRPRHVLAVVVLHLVKGHRLRLLHCKKGSLARVGPQHVGTWGLDKSAHDNQYEKGHAASHIFFGSASECDSTCGKKEPQLDDCV